jgi:F0F1-type ATP synthase assembly protein I
MNDKKEDKKDDKKDAKKDDIWTAFARYSALAVLLPASTLVGYAIGYGLDRLFSTHILKTVFLVVGTGAGFLQLIRGLKE